MRCVRSAEPGEISLRRLLARARECRLQRLPAGAPPVPVIPLDFGAGFQAGHRPGTTVPEPQKRHLPTGSFVIAHHGGNGAMLPKSICFVLAGLLVVVPLWILMSYGITADGRPSSPKILIGMTFCFVVGVFWLYEDLKDLLRTR